MSVASAMTDQIMYRLHCFNDVKEADEQYNDMTRKIIDEYTREYPHAMLGKFNSMDDVVLFPVPSRCLNFCADFIVSQDDKKLCKLVRQARSSHWDQGDYGRVMERIDDLVGISLDWT